MIFSFDFSFQMQFRQNQRIPANASPLAKWHLLTGKGFGGTFLNNPGLAVTPWPRLAPGAGQSPPSSRPRISPVLFVVFDPCVVFSQSLAWDVMEGEMSLIPIR